MKKGDVMDLDTLDKYYTTTRKIKFNNEIKIESLNDIYDSLFFKKYFPAENLPTYYMKGSQHCVAGRARSVDDFFRISKFYFPKMNIKTMIIFLKVKHEEHLSNDKVMRLGYCHVIRKYNFHGLTVVRSYYENILSYNFSNDGFEFDMSIKDIV
jgi:hypothetical protein